jgi:hypothetical protein
VNYPIAYLIIECVVIVCFNSFFEFINVNKITLEKNARRAQS